MLRFLILILISTLAIADDDIFKKTENWVKQNNAAKIFNEKLKQLNTTKTELPIFKQKSVLPETRINDNRHINNLLKFVDDNELQKQIDLQKSTDPYLYVFVSFSMPDSIIRQYLKQAELMNATLVLRGLVNNSMKSTVEKLAQFVDEKDESGMIIDPTLYERYKINMVPAFVLTEIKPEQCTKTKCETTEHIKMNGEVAISYALQIFRNHLSGKNKNHLINYIDKLMKRGS